MMKKFKYLHCHTGVLAASFAAENGGGFSMTGFDCFIPGSDDGDDGFFDFDQDSDNDE